MNWHPQFKLFFTIWRIFVQRGRLPNLHIISDPNCLITQLIQLNNTLTGFSRNEEFLRHLLDSTRITIYWLDPTRPPPPEINDYIVVRKSPKRVGDYIYVSVISLCFLHHGGCGIYRTKWAHCYLVNHTQNTLFDTSIEIYKHNLT